MILYNVTVKVDRQVQDEWLIWMKTVHIPEVLETGFFSGHTISRLLFQDDGDGSTFVMQYRCADIPTLNRYFDEHAPALQKAHTEKYKNKFVAFRTIMEEVSG